MPEEKQWSPAQIVLQDVVSKFCQSISLNVSTIHFTNLTTSRQSSRGKKSMITNTISVIPCKLPNINQMRTLCSNVERELGRATQHLMKIHESGEPLPDDMLPWKPIWEAITLVRHYVFDAIIVDARLQQVQQTQKDRYCQVCCDIAPEGHLFSGGILEDVLTYVESNYSWKQKPAFENKKVFELLACALWVPNAEPVPHPLDSSFIIKQLLPGFMSNQMRNKYSDLYIFHGCVYEGLVHQKLRESESLWHALRSDVQYHAHDGYQWRVLIREPTKLVIQYKTHKNSNTSNLEIHLEPPPYDFPVVEEEGFDVHLPLRSVQHALGVRSLHSRQYRKALLDAREKGTQAV